MLHNLGKRWGNELHGMQALRVNEPIDFKALWLTKDFAKLGWLIACLQNSWCNLEKKHRELLAENKRMLFKLMELGVLNFLNIYSASGSLLAHGLSKTFYREKDTKNFKRSLEYWNWFREIFHCVVSCLIHRRSGGALLSIGRAGHVWRRPGRLAPS